MFNFTKSLIFAALLLPATAEAYVKWVDEKGVAHFGNSIPPQAASRAREEKNKHGLTIRTIRAAKTEAEIAAERALAGRELALRARLKKQLTKDRVLMRTFVKEADLHAIRIGKKNSINTRVAQIQRNIIRANKKVLSNQKKAADYERKGQTVPVFLIQELEGLEKTINSSQKAINDYRAREKNIDEKLDQDLFRLRQLYGLNTLLKSRSHFSVGADIHKNTFECSNVDECTEAWVLAKQYLTKMAKKHTKNIPLLTSEIFIATPEVNDAAQYRILIGREFLRKKGARILIHTECMNSPSGKRLCKSPTLSNIRTGMKDFIQTHLDFITLTPN